jgi:PH domain
MEQPHHQQQQQHVSPAPLAFFHHRSSQMTKKKGRSATSNGGTQKTRRQQQQHRPRPLPQPLVLDASPSRRSLMDDDAAPIFSASVAAAAAAHRTPQPISHRRMPLEKQFQQPQQQHHPTQQQRPESALALARGAPLAGYLNKLGANVHEFKRRFFVLQPGTHLYYFLSADDAVPRGCVDLDGARIEPVLPPASADAAAWDEDDPHRGTTRGVGVVHQQFAIAWDEDDGGGGKTTRTIELEARSREDAQQWMDALRRERLPHVKEQLRLQQRKTSACHSRIAELERKLADLRYIEAERDDAVDDAAHYKAQLGELDEAIRTLTQQLTARISIDKIAKEDDDGTSVTGADSTDGEPGSNDECDDDSCAVLGEQLPHHNQHHHHHHNNMNNAAISMDPRQQKVPGTYFGGLCNTVAQLEENLRLAVQEAVTAVDDVRLAQAQVQATEVRMARAERHLCKMWEENCALRKALQGRKREKKLLVIEVKKLREDVIRQHQHQHQQTQSKPPVVKAESNAATVANRSDNDDGADEDDDEDGQKLIDDLERHVASSLQLHSEFLATNKELQVELGADAAAQQHLSLLDTSQSADGEDETLRYLIDSTVHLASPREKTRRALHPNVPLFDKQYPALPAASLFDNCDDEDDSDDDDVKGDGCDDALPLQAASLRSSVHAAEDHGECRSENHFDDVSLADEWPEHPNPLHQLDDDSVTQQTSRHCSASSHAAVARSIDPVLATATLTCPLADVVNANDDTCKKNANAGVDADGRVYHLTFYSRKIGIQFQRVPPPPAKSKGLLTEAMTIDVADAASGGEKNTAAELRRIAAIASRAAPGSKKTTGQGETECDVAAPLDAVLVCGFHGFDDSGNNVRPKLGARLVAFDGVSVELGRWTFDSVRKAIQARGRPLTLSFRNDFLTIEQRTILTKAVREVDEVTEEDRKSTHHHGNKATSSAPPAPDFERCRPSNDVGSVQSQDDDLSVSIVGNDYFRPLPISFSGARSVASSGKSNFRSFSEAGSSTSVLSAVAPLVSHLLSGRKGPFTPEYLRRAPASVEDTPQHQDFKSELL